MALKRLHEAGKVIVACETYILHSDAVLLHKRSADKKLFPGYWIGPGGHIDEGEDALSAAIREVREETGVLIKGDNIQLKVIAFHHHLDREEIWIEYLFRASIQSNQKVKDTIEGTSKWIPIDKLQSLVNIFPPSKYYLDHIIKNKPGILYNSSEWRNARLVRVRSEQVDKTIHGLDYDLYKAEQEDIASIDEIEKEIKRARREL